MRALLVSTMLMFSAPAWAGPFEPYQGQPGAVTISGTVEVPLYRGPSGSDVNVVQVAIGENTYMFALSTQLFHAMGEGVAKELGLEPKSGNTKLINLKGEDAKGKNALGEIQFVEVDEARIGDLTINNFRVLTKVGQIDSKPPQGVDGVLSVTALGVPWAMLPSAGVARFGTPDAGAEILGAVPGTPTAFTNQESFIEKFGKEGEVAGSGYTLITPVRFNGTEYQTLLSTIPHDQRVPVSIPLADDVPTKAIGDRDFAWLNVDLGNGADFSGWMWRWTGSRLFDGYLPPGTPEAVLAASSLNRFDIAADPATQQVVIGEIDDVVAMTNHSTIRQDPDAVLRAKLEKDLEKPEAPEDAPSETEEWTPPPPAVKALASDYASDGNYEKAIELVKPLTEEDPRDCSNWMALGEYQLKAGKLDAAAQSLATSSELHHAWWDLPRDERLEIGEDLAKLEKDEDKDALDAHEHHKQPGACHTADTMLAAVHMAEGRHDQVRAIYDAHLEYDPNLALILGNSEIAKGAYDDALEPYNQAVVVSHHQSREGRIAVGLTKHQQGRYADAAGVYARELVTHKNIDLAMSWLDALAKQGADVVAAGKQYWSDHRESAEGAYVWYRAALMAGDQAAAEMAEKKLSGDIIDDQTFEFSPDLLAVKARYLASKGELETARSAIAAGLGKDPSNARLLLTQAMLSEGAERDAAIKTLAYRAPADPFTGLAVAGKLPDDITSLMAPQDEETPEDGEAPSEEE